MKNILAWLPVRDSRRRRRELDEEIEVHLAIEIERRIEAGMSPPEAEIEARRLFGNVTIVKELTRDTWGWTTLEQLGQDLSYALRLFSRTPSFHRRDHSDAGARNRREHHPLQRVGRRHVASVAVSRAGEACRAMGTPSANGTV